MQKLLVLLTALTLMATLAACGGSNTRQNEPDNHSASGNDDVSSTGTVADSEYLYGKVTKITGNEIELALAVMPEDDAPSDEEDGKDTLDIPDGAAAGLVPATDAGSGATFEESMEYTGETLTLTIPAGTMIYSMGQESTITALKKGSLVSITIDNRENKNISSVSILS